MEPIRVQHEKRPYKGSLECVGGDFSDRLPVPCVHNGKKLIARLMPNGGNYQGLKVEGNGQIYDKYGHYGYVNTEYLPVLSKVLSKIIKKTTDDSLAFQKFSDAQKLAESLEGVMVAK